MYSTIWFKRPLAYSLIALMLFTMSASGCSTTHRVDTDYPEDSYREFEEKLADKQVKISLGDGTTHEGDNLNLNAVSTTWRGYTAGDEVNISTSEVWRLQTKSEGRGAWQGLLIGLLSGAAVGAMLGSTEDELFGSGNMAGEGAAAFGLVGGLLGLIIGQGVGATTTYEINPELAPDPPSQRGSRYQ